jgi:hypothetical protein
MPLARKKPRLVRENTDSEESSKTGLNGVYELALRRFRPIAMTFTLLGFFGVVSCLLGISLVPSIYLVTHAFRWADTLSFMPGKFIEATSVVLGFFAFGFTGIVVIPTANLLLRPFLKPFRGPAYSTEVLGWYAHNILLYSLRYSFLEWITPTPFNVFFYRYMGMKVGSRVEINTTNISDPAYITLEDGVTIGGSVSLLAHYAMGGYLIISPVVIRKKATIGLRAIIMGGVEIGEGAKVLPNSVVMPKTIIPAGETWAGVPARRYDGP